MQKYIKTYLLIYLIILSTQVSSQNKQYRVEHYSIRSGLLQNFVSCIHQDSKGYIWIGTQDGINRFDGYEFIPFRKNPAVENSLSNNYIIDIIGESDSALFIVNNDGLEKYHFADKEFTNVIKNKHRADSYYSINIQAVLEDDSGIIWLRTEDGIIEYDQTKEKFSEYKQSIIDSGFVSLYNYFSLKKDNEGNLWTGSKEGLVKFNTKEKTFRHFEIGENRRDNEVFYIYLETKENYIIGTKNSIYNFNPKSGEFTRIKSNFELSNVRAIARDRSGTLWVGTHYGLMYLLAGEEFLKPFNLDEYIHEEVEVGKVSDIFIDKSEIIWVSTDYGFFKIDSKEQPFILYRKEKNNKPNFSSNSIYAIFYDLDTELIWLGTRGYGINVFNRKNNDVKIYNKSNSVFKDNNINCIKNDDEGNIWIGTNQGVVIYEKKKDKFVLCEDYLGTDFKGFFSNNRLNDIYFENGNIWFASFNGILKYSNGTQTIYKKSNIKNTIVANDVFKIMKSSDGDFWIATLNGLSIFNPKNKKFRNYTHNDKKISNNSVLTVYETKDSTIWIGTGTGLNKYIAEKDSFIYYTSFSHGFNNDFIYSITEDSHNNLWLSTNNGIVKFNIRTEETTNYSEEDNLQGFEFNIGAMYSSENDEIFWGGLNGLNSINLKQIKNNFYVPKPIITRIVKRTQKGDENIIVNSINEIKLSYDESSFEIHFAVPEYTYPRKNKFKYRIIESDKNWINLGTENTINFYRLSPGKYTFQIIGANSNNHWNLEPESLIINISAPWWQSTGAYISYIIILALITGGGFIIYNREIRKENKILTEKQEVAKEVDKQRDLLAIKNTNIAESMRYASGIINSLLPANNYINELLPDSFVLFMSKEIVSGDFYWVDETEDKIFAAAVDCTGHGIPGAFMSIIGLDLLDDILTTGIDTPAKILDELNKGIAGVFKKDKNNKELKDGMDISIVALHKKSNLLEFAGAINQIFIIRDGNIIEVKGDRFSISPANFHEFGKFSNHVFELEDQDMIYLFSDGYADQFGGPDEKKFKYRRFRHMLLNNYHKPVKEQHKTLVRVINTWRGLLEQVDDILVMGIRYHSNDSK